MADSEYDGDRSGRSFGSERSRVGSRSRYHSHLAVDQIGHQSWQAVVMAFHPMVFDGHVLPVDAVRFAEALIEGSHIARVGLGVTDR